MDSSLRGVAVPCVDVVHGVVCAEEEVSGVGGEDYGGVWFFEDVAAGDALFAGGDVVCEDGEVDGCVGIGFVAVAVFVDAATASLGVEDAVCAADGGDGHGADGALVVGAGVFGGEAGAAGGGFDDPFGVLCAEHDGGLAGEHPADGGLSGGVHGEVDAGGVEVAGGEGVEVVCLAHPDGLGLGVGGGEDEAGFMERGDGGVAEAGVEGAP